MPHVRRQPRLVHLPLSELGFNFGGVVQRVPSYLWPGRPAEYRGLSNGVCCRLRSSASGCILLKAFLLLRSQYPQSLRGLGTYTGTGCSRSSFSCFHSGRVVFDLLPPRSCPQPPRHPFDIVARCSPPHGARHLLEGTGGIGGFAFLHARFESLDFKLASVEKLLQVQLAVIQGGILRLRADVARIVEFDALHGATARTSIFPVALVASSRGRALLALLGLGGLLGGSCLFPVHLNIDVPCAMDSSSRPFTRWDADSG